MPGPGPHMMYTLGSGEALKSISNGRFSPHHCLVYSINAFFGPDIGSFSEWLTSTLGLGGDVGSAVESENGQSSIYKWILSTGWWKGRAPVNQDAVIVVSFLCICLIGGFVYINRVKASKSQRNRSHHSARLLLIIAGLYCLWCASQIYLVSPRRPAVGEEADLGVLVFLATYFFLPHVLCIMSMNSREVLESAHLPL